MVEGTRERVQVYEGVVIARTAKALNSSFTVRKISYGGERVFPFYSPRIEKIEVVAAAPSDAVGYLWSCRASPPGSPRRSIGVLLPQLPVTTPRLRPQRRPSKEDEAMEQATPAPEEAEAADDAAAEDTAEALEAPRRGRRRGQERP